MHAHLYFPTIASAFAITATAIAFGYAVAKNDKDVFYWCGIGNLLILVGTFFKLTSIIFQFDSDWMVYFIIYLILIAYFCISYLVAFLVGMYCMYKSTLVK
ncbi:hypothetical protein A2Z33_02300 [Candidatus Gottesmanbacteria bacterium RBG_16_52_11]|uniref:Uncharacterized protein n=1 Tax=Candidatus Gottesmanbacteria bacterium RBG_16_52_11 TaxID=1798374 RepID=A0A1F5YR44_9BACT|nr:MAG: hypothetical protein A2Z33_02300 [Candidatus Gottesmanbacteria bacterium RBG_16_52_11]